MQAQPLSNGDEQVFVLIFDKGDEFVSQLTRYAKVNHIEAASFTAIGAFENATLGYYDRQTQKYIHIPVDEQVEVLTLTGDISLKEDGEPQVHAHVVVGRRDGTTRGGHLIDARVWPTLELVLTATPQHLRRTYDPESGIALINLKASRAES